MSKKEITYHIKMYLDDNKCMYQFFGNNWHDYFLLDTGVLKGFLLFAFLLRFNSNKYIINTAVQVERFRLKFNHIIKII